MPFENTNKSNVAKNRRERSDIRKQASRRMGRVMFIDSLLPDDEEERRRRQRGRT